MIVNYHNENYVGDHIIVTAVGDLNHDELVAAVEKYITVPARNAHPRAQIAKPVFTPGISYLSSDLTENVNVVTVHEAPSFFDNEFFAYLLLQRLVADRP